MKLRGSLRLRLVIVIALIGLLAVFAAWFASRQVTLEEAGVLGRLEGDEAGEMAQITDAVEDVAEAHSKEGAWTSASLRAAGVRLDALLLDLEPSVIGYELLDDSGRLVASFDGRAPDGPRLQAEIFREAAPIALLHLHGEAPTPAAEQKFVVLQHDTVDIGSPSPRAGMLVASVVAALTLVLLIGVVLRLTRPLRALNETVTRFGAGDTNARLDVRGDDEIAQLSRAFNDMADALAENEARRRNLVNDVAHELRTPLTNLRFRLESVLDGVVEATPEEIASMHADTVRLQRLVEDLQLLAAAEGGELRLKPRVVDLHGLVSHLATDALLQVHNEVPEDACVHADPVRLEQVLTNLFGNAIRHAPGSAVRVSAGLGRRADTQAQAGAVWQTPRPSRDEDSADAPVVTIEVADTGPGIPREALPFVFDRFYRVDASRDRSTGGSGLGLAIVRQLVEAQGGFVGVRCPAMGGTEFLVVLPARSVQERRGDLESFGLPP